MRELLDADGELVDRVRNAIVDPAEVNYRPTEAMLVPAPGHRGPVVLVGDAAHTTTPHLAFGAGIAVEDSVVLSEVAAGEPGRDGALERYVARRYARCRFVVENSVQLGAWGQTRETRTRTRRASPGRAGTCSESRCEPLNDRSKEVRMSTETEQSKALVEGPVFSEREIEADSFRIRMLEPARAGPRCTSMAVAVCTRRRD